MKHSGWFLLRAVLIAGAILLVVITTASAAPLSDGITCDPFEADGSPKSEDACACSNDPDDNSYCMSGFQYMVIGMTDQVRNGQYLVLEGVAQVSWLLMRVSAAISESLISGEALESLRDGIWTQVQTIMGGESGVLWQLIGGSNGLFTVALMLAGFLMTIPFFGAAASLVRVERVIVWGVVILALFVFGAFGFDLMEGIEGLRIDLIDAVVQGNGEGTRLRDLVALPMGITDSSQVVTLDENDLLALPTLFESQYFPEARYERRRVKALDNPGSALDMMFTAEILEDQTNRAKASSEGMFRLVMALAATVVLVLFGIVFALLSVAALILLIFFIAAIPLGFFEFGSQILMSIAKQYVNVVALSLLVAVLARVLTTMVSTLAGTSLADMAGKLTYLVGLALLGLLVGQAVKWAWKSLDNSVSVMGNSINNVAVAAAGGGGGILAGAGEAAKSAANTAVTTAVAAGTAALTGGASLALAAGAGGLLAGTKAGHTAADVAQIAAPASENAAVFASAARSSTPGNAMSGLIATHRRQAVIADAAGDGYAESSNRGGGIAYRDARVDGRWQAVDGGGYLTADLRHLGEAEEAFFQKRDESGAYYALERTFGSQEMAERVLSTYRQQGLPGAAQTRRVVETAQSTALAMSADGQNVMDAGGRLTPDYQHQVRQSLIHDRLLNPRQVENAAYAGALVGSTVRKPESIWNDPEATHKLAQDTLYAPDPTEVAAGDVSARYALHAMAVNARWDEGQLEALFDVVREAIFAGFENGQDPMNLIGGLAAERMPGIPASVREEAARLAYLSAAEAQIQHPATMPAGWEVDAPDSATLPPEWGASATEMSEVSEAPQVMTPEPVKTPPAAPEQANVFASEPLRPPEAYQVMQQPDAVRMEQVPEQAELPVSEPIEPPKAHQVVPPESVRATSVPEQANNMPVSEPLKTPDAFQVLQQPANVRQAPEQAEAPMSEPMEPPETPQAVSPELVRGDETPEQAEAPVSEPTEHPEAPEQAETPVSEPMEPPEAPQGVSPEPVRMDEAPERAKRPVSEPLETPDAFQVIQQPGAVRGETAEAEPTETPVSEPADPAEKAAIPIQPVSAGTPAPSVHPVQPIQAAQPPRPHSPAPKAPSKE